MEYLIGTSFVFLLIVATIFFFKPKINNSDTIIYKKIISANLLGLLIDLIQYILIQSNFNVLISKIIGKIFLAYVFFWTYLLFKYIINISSNVNSLKTTNKKFNIAAIALLIVGIVLELFLPIEIINDTTGIYTKGLACSLGYVVISLYIIIMLIVTFINIKKVEKKNKYIPFFVFLVIGTIATVVQAFIPKMLLITPVESIITLLIYFFIENPDVKMLNEVYKNKELMEQNYEDKYNFLFEITQEAKNPLKNIIDISNELRETNDIERIKAGTLAISNLSKQLDFTINNVLNVSTLDVQKIKLVNTKYDLSKICKDIVAKISKEVNSNVEFKFSYPEEELMLYGDYMKIRQIVYSIISSSISKTTSGFIDFKVNTILKYDVCRIIFSISDSGPGISIEKINEILGNTGEFSKEDMENLEKSNINVKLCQKVVKLMGGNLMIKSNLGVGTDFNLTIDQRVYHESNESILTQYENAINNYKKILIVSQDRKLINRIKYVCHDNNITYSNLLYGMDAIDKIKEKKRFDFILISDDMKEMSGLMTMKGMNEIDGFKTPTIVMLNKGKEEIKEEYIKDGFNDYLLIDDFDNEIKRIIEKY